MRCSGCGEEIRGVVWQKEVGWERHREAGGTNHVALRRTLDEYLCDSCMYRERHGVSAGQTSLT